MEEDYKTEDKGQDQMLRSLQLKVPIEKRADPLEGKCSDND